MCLNFIGCALQLDHCCNPTLNRYIYLRATPITNSVKIKNCYAWNTELLTEIMKVNRNLWTIFKNRWDTKQYNKFWQWWEKYCRAFQEKNSILNIPDHQQDAERHKTHQEGNNDDKKHAVDVSVDDCSTAQIIRHDWSRNQT